MNTKNSIQPQETAKASTSNIPRIMKRLIFLVLALFVIILGGLVFLFFSKLDRNIFPITITGNVKDSISGEVLDNAVVQINDISTRTNSNGDFKLVGYFRDELEISTKADRYKDFSEKVTLARNFLAFNFTINLKLNPAESSIVKGRLTSDESYDFSGDQVYIDSNLIKLNTDGSFTASNIKKGTVVFNYKSTSNKDLLKPLVVNEGINIIDDIATFPAGDIVGNFVDWVDEKSAIKPELEVSNTEQGNVDIDDSGRFFIKDLNIGDEYTIRISHKDYLTRDYKVKIVRGENQIFGLKMIPNDIRLSYLRRADGGIQIYAADLDGANEKQITNIRGFNPENIFFRNNEIYFTDTYERLKGTASGSLDMGYRLNLVSEQQDRLTENIAELGNLFYFYRSEKVINVIPPKASNNREITIELRNIDGSNPQKIVSGKSLELSNINMDITGQFLLYSLRDTGSKIDNTYSWDSKTGLSELLFTDEEVTIQDVSADGNKLLITKINASTRFQDLVVFDVNQKSTLTLIQSNDASNFKFDEGSNEVFYFTATRDGRNNLFKYNLKLNQTTRITFLNVDDEISYYYIIGRYIFYRIEDTLHVLDKGNVVNYKKLVSEVE